MISTAYFHAIDGRIRIHVPEVKKSGVTARQTTARLMGFDGIVNVNANPVTGNVLINYDTGRISEGEVFQVLRDSGYLTKDEISARNTREKKQGRSELGDTIARLALEALFYALTN